MGGESALEEFAKQLPDRGTFSVWYGPAEGPPRLTHRPDERHYAASTMKLALVIAAFRRADAGILDLDAQVTVHNEFSSAFDGSAFGVDREEDSDAEPWRRLGERVALRWLCHRAIVRSSNLATNLVLEQVGTEAVADVLQAAGATHSTVLRGIEDLAGREAGLQNWVTAADLAATLQSLVAGRLLSSAGTAEVLDVLAAQQINDAIPVGLPPGTRIAHKSGWIEGISHDAAVIYPDPAEPFVFVMCTTSELSEQQSLDLIAAGARAAWSDWTERADV